MPGADLHQYGQTPSVLPTVWKEDLWEVRTYLEMLKTKWHKTEQSQYYPIKKSIGTFVLPVSRGQSNNALVIEARC